MGRRQRQKNKKLMSQHRVAVYVERFSQYCEGECPLELVKTRARKLKEIQSTRKHKTKRRQL